MPTADDDLSTPDQHFHRAGLGGPPAAEQPTGLLRDELLAARATLDKRDHAEQDAHETQKALAAEHEADDAGVSDPADLESDREESDGEFLARLGADPEKWTNEFLGRFGDKVAEDTSPGTDFHHTVLGWFSNAIGAGMAEANSRVWTTGPGIPVGRIDMADVPPETLAEFLAARADEYERLTGHRPNRYITENPDAAAAAEALGMASAETAPNEPVDMDRDWHGVPTTRELVRIHTNHAPTPEQARLLDEITERCLGLGLWAERNLPHGDELCVALSGGGVLDELRGLLKAAVARRHLTAPPA